MDDVVQKEAVIGDMSDGWSIELEGITVTWNHNDPQVPPLKKLLEHLGYTVFTEDWF